MAYDSVSVARMRVNLDLLCDVHMLLGLSCLLPLLEAINALIKFSQGKDVFMCDFMAIAKICLANLFMMYFDPNTSYQHEHFQVFCDVVENNFATIT
jgi:hypothetical protein